MRKNICILNNIIDEIGICDFSDVLIGTDSFFRFIHYGNSKRFQPSFHRTWLWRESVHKVYEKGNGNARKWAEILICIILILLELLALLMCTITFIFVIWTTKDDIKDMIEAWKKSRNIRKHKQRKSIKKEEI